MLESRNHYGATFLWAVVMLTIGFGSGPASVNAQLDNQKLAARGLRLTSGKHLTLVTDVRDRTDVDQFHQVFDQAVLQWCEYFGIDPADAESWHIVACVIADLDKFQKTELLPEDLPNFPAGFQRGPAIWLHIQPGTYYTRHLLLHEGTHAFMDKFLGGYGPPWYAEGMAELLAVHRWQNGKLQIKHKIAHRDEVPYWGRVKLVRSDRLDDKSLSIESVMWTVPSAYQNVRYYGWSWAACEFFDSHPDCQEAFRRLPQQANRASEDFNRDFKAAISDHWSAIQIQWQIMVDELDYGYDVARSRIIEARRESSGGSSGLIIACDRGWQDTGIKIVQDRSYRITASGEFQVKDDGQPWPSRAGGITMEYYRGKPLGQLIAAIQVDDDLGDRSLKPVAIGTGGEFRFGRSGRLYLRINESPSQWHDNQGVLQVKIEPQ